MRRIIFSFVLLACFSVIGVFAQKNESDNLGFNETWQLFKSETKRAGKQLDSEPKPAILKIIYSGTEFKVIESQTAEEASKQSGEISIFFTDRRGEQNRNIKTQTWEKGNKIVVSEKIDPKYEIYLVKAYSLSKNGDELTVKTFPFVDPNDQQRLVKESYRQLPPESEQV